MKIREATLADAANIARVHVDSWRTAYRGLMPDTLLDNLSYESRERMWKRILADSERREFVYVVEDDQGRIIGFASGGASRDKAAVEYQSELFAIYLLEEHRGHGLGKRLFLQVVERLVQMGMNSMLLYVLAGNPASYFYEKLGGKYLKDGIYETNGLQFKQVAYGWLDLCLLVNT